jgi:hypothetical protein
MVRSGLAEGDVLVDAGLGQSNNWRETLLDGAAGAYVGHPLSLADTAASPCSGGMLLVSFGAVDRRVPIRHSDPRTCQDLGARSRRRGRSLCAVDLRGALPECRKRRAASAWSAEPSIGSVWALGSVFAATKLD